MNHLITRRNFVKSATTLVAAASLSGPLFGQVHGGRTLKVAVVGCGGRGPFDLGKFIKAAELLGHKVEVVALADAFRDKVEAAAARFEVAPNRLHWGFDSYQKVMESDAEYVILASPPNFRVLHMQAAIEAGKHVMAEKPVAVDGPGIRKFIEVGELARAKGLAIAVGMQRRHDLRYLRNKALIDAGAVGPILGGTVSWNGNVPWVYERQPGWSDADYMARNWLNFVEMSGDHIVEQHMHNLDVANWFLGRVPVSALGFGGRMRRESGNQYDFFSVEYDYGDGVRIQSQCRQISGTYERIGEFFRGSEGQLFGGGKLEGKQVAIPEITLETDDSVAQVMVSLIKGVQQGKPVNQSIEVAQATAVAVMGRISAYTGKLVRWVDVMENPNSEYYNLQIGPDAKDFEREGVVVAPPEDVVPLPGDGVPIRRKS